MPPISFTEIEDLTTGDLDEDGHVDLLATTKSSYQVAYMGEGTGAFAVGFMHHNSTMQATLVADIDQDGHLDLISPGSKDFGSSNHKARLLVQRGAGNGAFFSPTEHMLGDTWSTWATDATITDLDRDGHLDVLAVVTGPDTVSTHLWVIPGTDGGTLGIPVQLPNELTPRVTDLATTDLDGDGIDDLVASRWSGHSHVFFGNGAGELVDRHDLDTRNDAGIGAVEVADLDADGKPDLIYGSQPCELGQTHCRPPRLLVMPNALNGRPDH